MTVRTWVGRFCAAEGRVEEEGPWLGSLVRQRPDDEPDELYVLVEPATRHSIEYTAQLVDVVVQLYGRDPLSLTGALTRSMRAAHEHLREWNRKSLPEHRAGAGASCLAIRGSEVYLAQVGPGVAYVRTAAGELRRYESGGSDFEHSLGVGEEFEPRLTRITLQSGDLVLVASSAIDTVLPQRHIERVLSRGADDALPELYLLCRDLPDFALVLLSALEPEPEAPPDFLTRNGSVSYVEPASMDDAPPAAQGVLVGAAAGDAPPAAEASLAAGTAGDFALPSRPAHEQVREIKESTAPPPATGVRLRGEGAAPRYRRTTGPLTMPQFRIHPLLVVGVVALAIVGLLAYAFLPGSVKESREAKFTTLVAAAREDSARAQATSDAGVKRQLLQDAQTKLAAAEKIHKDQTDVVSLRSDVTSALGVLDAVYEIKDFTPVVDLQQSVTGQLSVSRMVIGSGQVFFLDTKGKRVLAVTLASPAAPATLLADGEPGGFITAGRPAQLAWSEQDHALTMIDANRQVFSYNAASNNTGPLSVRAIDSLASIDAITTSGGNLYVLDVKENQVWRYLPGQSGYDSERTALLDAPSLKDATELAVGQDVYVLDDKLGVRRFIGKAEAPFPMSGIDTPMMSPASISVLPGSNRIVVADRGNKRIVVASADGIFLRQIVSPALTDLRAVWVDEGNGILYVLNGATLLKAPFPP